jgi:hypothetical protein
MMRLRLTLFLFAAASTGCLDTADLGGGSTSGEGSASSSSSATDESSSEDSASGSESGSTAGSDASSSTGANPLAVCGCPPDDVGELVYIADYLRECEEVPEPCGRIDAGCATDDGDYGDAAVEACFEAVELTPGQVDAIDCHLEFLETGSEGTLQVIVSLDGGFYFRTRQFHIDSDANATLFDEFVWDTDGTATSLRGESLTDGSQACTEEATPNGRLLCLWNLADSGDPITCEEVA